MTRGGDYNVMEWVRGAICETLRLYAQAWPPSCKYNYHSFSSGVILVSIKIVFHNGSALNLRTLTGNDAHHYLYHKINYIVKKPLLSSIINSLVTYLSFPLYFKNSIMWAYIFSAKLTKLQCKHSSKKLIHFSTYRRTKCDLIFKNRHCEI